MSNREAWDLLEYSYRFSHKWTGSTEPQFPFKSLRKEISTIVNDSPACIAAGDPRFRPFLVKLPRRTAVHPRNRFIVESMIAIGGGGLALLKRGLAYMRGGGGTADKIRYLLASDPHPGPGSHGLDAQRVAALVYPEGLPRATLPPPRVILSHLSLNHDASAGVVASFFGVTKKAELVAYVPALLRFLVAHWTSIPRAPDIEELWATAARPKLFHMREKVSGVRGGNPVARVIAVPSAFEFIAAYPLYFVVEQRLREAFRLYGHGVAIGINRHGADWKRLGHMFSGASAVLTLDYSKFDLGVSRVQLEFALEFYREHFDLEHTATGNYFSNYARYYQRQVISKRFVVDRGIQFETSRSMPSGSLWTSVGNSVINYAVLHDACTACGYSDFKVVVYGDDSLVFFYGDAPTEERVKQEFIPYIWGTHGLTVDSGSVLVSRPEEFFVTYERPVFDPADLRRAAHTSKLQVKSVEYAQSPFRGADRSTGRSHRWNYTFARRPTFLKYAWTGDLRAIRPWSETFIRLLNPENAPKTAVESMAHIVAHAVDNYENAHVRNWLYQILYDHTFMRDARITRSGALEGTHLARAFYTDPALVSGLLSQSGRAWYRRERKFPDLHGSPRMRAFNKMWDAVVRVCEAVKNAGAGVEGYRVGDAVRAAVCGGLRDHSSPTPGFGPLRAHADPGFTYFRFLFSAIAGVPGPLEWAWLGSNPPTARPVFSDSDKWYAALSGAASRAPGLCYSLKFYLYSLDQVDPSVLPPVGADVL